MGRLVDGQSRDLFRAATSLLQAPALLAAGCQVIPKTDVATAPPPPAPTPEPSATALPTDSGPPPHRAAGADERRHRPGRPVDCQCPPPMALLDTGADNLRITTYDTSTGVSGAARQAIADGNRLISRPIDGRCCIRRAVRCTRGRSSGDYLSQRYTVRPRRMCSFDGTQSRTIDPPRRTVCPRAGFEPFCRAAARWRLRPTFGLGAR